MANILPPFQYRLLDSSGNLEQVWAFFFSQLVGSDPNNTGGNNFIINGNNTPITISEGAYSNIPAPSNGNMYLATDLGLFFVAIGSVWHPVFPEIYGDVTNSPATPDILTLNQVNLNPGTYENATITVNSKGLVTLASNGSSGFVTTFNAGSTGLTPTSNNSGAITLGGILNLASGGTNSNLTALAGAVAYSTSTAIALSAAGTASQLLQSNGTSAPSWTGAPAVSGANITSGSIPNAALANFSIAVSNGSGIGVSGSPVNLGGTVNISNTGVLSATGTTNQITVSASTGSITWSIPNAFVAPGSVTATTNLLTSKLNNVTAAGSTQGTATALTNDINRIVTCPSGAGVILTVGAGSRTTIVNSGLNPVLVYPPSGGGIGYVGNTGQTANAPITVNVGATVEIIAVSSGQFWAVAIDLSNLSGTANQIVVSGSSSGATLSVPSTFIAPGSAQSSTPVNSLNSGIAQFKSGSWTPSVVGLTTTGASPSFSGTYLRIGNLVIINFLIVTSGTTQSTAGSTRITGLPYSTNNNNANYGTMGFCDFAINSLGNGAIGYYSSTALTTIFAPAWPLDSNNIVGSGYYFTADNF